MRDRHLAEDVAVYSKCPTLKVKNVNPNSGRSFTMNPVTDKFKWEEVKDELCENMPTLQLKANIFVGFEK